MHALAFRLALGQLKQKPLARVFVVLSVGCVLVLNALLFMLFQGFSGSLAEAQRARFVTAYLEPTATAAREAEVVSAVRKIPGVNSAQLVTKEAFLSNFGKYFPQLSSDLSGLDSEVIPRFVKVRAAPETADEVATALGRLKGIEFVELNKTKFAGLLSALSTLRRLALALFAGCSLALLCILFNHFRLGTHFQKQVMGTLRLLGAKGGEAALPFAIEGVIEGAAAGLLAGGVLIGFGKSLEGQLNAFFSGIGYQPFHFEFATAAIFVVGVGTLSGMIGSLWAIARVQR